MVYNLFFSGGKNLDCTLKSIEVYNYKLNQFQPFDPLPEPLMGCAAVYFEEELWVIGGMGPKIKSMKYAYQRQGLTEPPNQSMKQVYVSRVFILNSFY